MSARPEFDIVIVGAGAAGCVVAARLSESISRSVCLLEAGPDLRGALSDDFRDGWHIPQGYDWGDTSEPNEAGAVEKLRRSKLLGGTSFLTRFALRGSPADYDEWRELGNDGWGFDDLLPAFIRLEADADFGDQPWHGKDGLIPIRRYFDREPTDVGAAGRIALEAVGFPPIDDHNQPGAVGVGPMPMSSTDGIRTTVLAYLAADPAASALTVRPDSNVSEVVFEANRAVGVRLLDDTEIRAGCVVLCAGTYGSPTILMRSGIGEPDHLRSVGIDAGVPLSGVGSNLADHPGLDIDCGYRGPLRAAPLLHSVATFHSSETDAGSPPDLMLWMQDPVALEGVSTFEIDIVLLKPRARGTVRLRSRDPSDPPRIQLPALRDRIDVARLVEGYRRALEIAHRPEIRRLCVEAPSIPTDDELPHLVRTSTYSVPHVVGTCAMGSSPDDGAVVDASGRVHGTEHLFVVDASIMPTVPSGFPHIPTIMIAERLSELISASFD